MKFQSTIALALSASAALALSIPKGEIEAPRSAEQLFTLEFAPGETKQVTEAEKWELFNVSPLNTLCVPWPMLSLARLGPALWT